MNIYVKQKNLYEVYNFQLYEIKTRRWVYTNYGKNKILSFYNRR